MSSGNQARAALQKYFPRPFTDLQWEMLVAQGYERSILAGERTPEEVMAELLALMAAVRGDPADAHLAGQMPSTFDSQTWEVMEKLVLARALLAGDTGGPTPERRVPGSDTIGRGLCASTLAFPDPHRRPWWLWTSLGVLVIAAVAALVLVYVLGWEPWASSNTPPTSTPSVADVAVLGGTSPAVTTTKAPPATATSTTGSTTSSTTSSTSTTVVDVAPTYTARLRGDQAIPAVTTDAVGTVRFIVAEDGASVDYVFEVYGLADLTLARVRVGEAGATGDEVFTLYPGPVMAGAFSGVVVEGSLTEADLLGPLAGKTIVDLVALLDTGSVYVNVGTLANPGGEIRGQLE